MAGLDFSIPLSGRVAQVDWADNFGKMADLRAQSQNNQLRQKNLDQISRKEKEEQMAADILRLTGGDKVKAQEELKVAGFYGKAEELGKQVRDSKLEEMTFARAQHEATATAIRQAQTYLSAVKTPEGYAGIYQSLVDTLGKDNPLTASIPKPEAFTMDFLKEAENWGLTATQRMQRDSAALDLQIKGIEAGEATERQYQYYKGAAEHALANADSEEEWNEILGKLNTRTPDSVLNMFVGPRPTEQLVEGMPGMSSLPTLGSTGYSKERVEELRKKVESKELKEKPGTVGFYLETYARQQGLKSVMAIPIQKQEELIRRFHTFNDPAKGGGAAKDPSLSTFDAYAKIKMGEEGLTRDAITTADLDRWRDEYNKKEISTAQRNDAVKWRASELAKIEGGLAGEPDKAKARKAVEEAYAAMTADKEAATTRIPRGAGIFTPRSSAVIGRRGDLLGNKAAASAPRPAPPAGGGVNLGIPTDTTMGNLMRQSPPASGGLFAAPGAPPTPPPARSTPPPQGPPPQGPPPVAPPAGGSAPVQRQGLPIESAPEQHRQSLAKAAPGLITMRSDGSQWIKYPDQSIRPYKKPSGR